MVLVTLVLIHIALIVVEGTSVYLIVRVEWSGLPVSNGFQSGSILKVNDIALSILKVFLPLSMHFIKIPAAFVDSIHSLKDAFALPHPVFMLSLVLVPIQVPRDAEAFPLAFVEHAFVDEAVPEVLVADAVHLALGVHLPVVNVAVHPVLLSLHSLNYMVVIND